MAAITRPHRSPVRVGLLKALAPLAAIAALGGCSTVDALNAVEPKGGLTVTHDIAYGEGSRRRLDIYAPRKTSAAPTPVVVFFYGGGWETGSKNMYGWVGAALARQGYLVLVPDYRVYPDVRCPTFLEDSARAVRWARDHAADYGGDPGRLVLMGHSAGAYNAAMLTLDHRWLGQVGMNPDRDIRAFVGLAGPYDFLPLKSEVLKTIFGPEDSRPATQPIQYVTAAAPPMLLIAPVNDTVVDPENVTRLATRIREKGGRVETRRYPRLNHATTVGALAAPLRWMAPVLKDARAFIDANTGTPR
jgi:acetyl esterase/lipase